MYSPLNGNCMQMSMVIAISQRSRSNCAVAAYLGWIGIQINRDVEFDLVTVNSHYSCRSLSAKGSLTVQLSGLSNCIDHKQKAIILRSGIGFHLTVIEVQHMKQDQFELRIKSLWSFGYYLR